MCFSLIIRIIAVCFITIIATILISGSVFLIRHLGGVGEHGGLLAGIIVGASGGGMGIRGILLRRG